MPPGCESCLLLRGVREANSRTEQAQTCSRWHFDGQGSSFLMENNLGHQIESPRSQCTLAWGKDKCTISKKASPPAKTAVASRSKISDTKLDPNHVRTTLQLRWISPVSSSTLRSTPSARVDLRWGFDLPHVWPTATEYIAMSGHTGVGPRPEGLAPAGVRSL